MRRFGKRTTLALVLAIGMASAACTTVKNLNRDSAMLNDSDPVAVESRLERLNRSGAGWPKPFPVEPPIRATPDQETPAAMLIDLEGKYQLIISQERIDRPVPLPVEPKR